MDPDRIGAAQPDESSPQARGRVLRVKQGYNPNSSSVGSALPTYLAFAAASGALTALLLHVTGSVAALLRTRKTGAAGSEPASVDAPSPSPATGPTEGSPPEPIDGETAARATPEPTDDGSRDDEPQSAERA